MAEWWNFRAEQYVSYPDNEMPPADVHKDYMMQIPALHSMYDVYIKMGKTPADALLLCLRASVGELD